ncbi:MAG: hypothetical protein AAFP03_08270 [Cyanobacteria bacterium J06598_3]
MENRNEFQAPVAPPVSSERSEGHNSLWDAPGKKKRQPLDRTVVEPPEELILPDVSTLLGYNPPPPDYSDHVKWGGLGKPDGNSQQNGELEGEASAEGSANVAQPAKAEPPSSQKAPPAGAANKQTGVLEGGALLYIVTVLVTGAVVGYVSAWLFEEANQIVVRSGPSPDGPWQDAGVAPADAYAGLVGNGLMEALVSDYSADINASMEGFTPPRLGGFELGEGTPPEPTVTPRLEVGNTIFSTPWDNAQILERLTTPTQQVDARDFVMESNEGDAAVPWRGVPHIDNERWTHIESRHVTGTVVREKNDLFAPGTTREQLEEAAQEVVATGTRISQPSEPLQTFEERVIINGQRDRVRVIIDTTRNGRVHSMFPVRSE